MPQTRQVHWSWQVPCCNSSQRGLRDQEQQNHSLQHHRSQLETEVQELREQLQQCQVQLQGAQQQATHHVAALGQLQEALQAAEARTGQSQVTATETVRELQQAHASSQQELAAALGQADILRSSLEAARADSQRLQHESELVLADVQQWATEQKRANERLGQKLREQSKQLVRLTGEREHLQEVLAQLQQQNKRLAAAAEQHRITCERFRALQGRSVDAGALLHWLWLPLPREDSGPACAQQPLPLPSAVDHEPRQTAQP
ncbi:PREDICTED: polyamine-modulated factor 1-binding protein 1 [Crocodylus porosus]|uniref:polyamine-modulated factor 1-binding protein 1 n=1 Tax=Crocodylus porosus TaxID=8502 RepID=UPI0009391578|nr:PREDICTED: polyamine-modulated factor 1-binding protein 1 [Crocodylus porosus]